MHAEDHQGGDNAPAEVTTVRMGPLAQARFTEYMEMQQRYADAQRRELEEFFSSLSEESPFHRPPQEQQDPSA